MIYLNTFRTAFLMFPLVAFLITIPFILTQYHRYGSINKLRTLIIYSFILYLMTIYFLVILPLPSKEYVANLTTPRYQLIPFKFIYDFIKETPLIWNQPGTYLLALKHSSFYTVVFNIFMTMPFGMYLRYYFKCDLKKTIKWSFLLSLFFEVTQATGLYFIYPRPYRLFDVDDLMMNTLGGVLGYLLMGAFKFLPSRDSIDRKTYEEAQVVSGFRRVTLFCLDLVLFNLIDGLVMMMVYILNKNMYHGSLLYLVVFITYYVVIPYFRDGKTLGSGFVHVKFIFLDKNFLRLLIKALCEYGYYFVGPLAISFGFFKILGYLNLDMVLECLLIILGSLIYLKIYIGNFLKLLRTHQIFYDRISKVNFVRTITRT